MDFNDLHFDQIQFLESILFEGLGREVSVDSYLFLSGGDINTALRIDTGEGYYLVKWNESAGEDLFACESKGLQLLREADAIRVPGVIGYGRRAEKAYLLLEFISSARPQPAYWANFGEGLAALHAHTGPTFGLPYDNYIGSLAQRNAPQENGVRFFVENRLQAQAGLAFYNGQLPKALHDKFTTLYERLAVQPLPAAGAPQPVWFRLPGGH
jgi:fructosamine-3-kinase